MQQLLFLSKKTAEAFNEMCSNFYAPSFLNLKFDLIICFLVQTSEWH